MNPIPLQANVRARSLVARADGTPIIAGTVNYYLIALTGANVGKWFRTSDNSWQAAEAIAGVMAHKADGDWSVSVDAEAWPTAGVEYTEYAKESGDLHVPTSMMIRCEDTTTTLHATTDGLVEGIGTAGGAALNTDVNDDNYDGGITGVTSGTTKIGTETNDYTATPVLDGTCHIMTHTAQEVDIVYQFLCGGGTSPVALVWTGLLNPNNDTVTFSVWNHVGVAWEAVGSIAGQSSTVAMVVKNIVLYARHMGTSATELGKVYLRCHSTESYNHILRTDQVYTTYAVTSRTVGYENGAVWVDTVNGTAGTESYVNGTADNAVLTWADAKTIAAAVGLEKFEVVNGSTITLDANADNYTFDGEAWTLVLGTQSCSGASFSGATAVSGVCTGANPPQFHRCMFNSATIPPSHLYECGFNGTLTFGSAGEYSFANCYSMVGGTNTPVLDFGSGLNASEVNMRSYSGGWDIRNMGAGTGSYNMSLEGWGQLIVNANCSATSTIAIRGCFTISGDATAIAAITFSDDARIDVDQINTACDTALSDWGKTGFSVSQTGLDAVLKTTTFALAMADAIWDEAISGHTTVTTFGGKNQKVVPSETVADYKATGFSTHNAADVYTAFGTGGNLTTCATATGFSTHNAGDVYTAFGTGGNLTTCATAVGFSTHSAANVVTALSTGSTLSAIPWNSSWDTEVESEVTDALVALNLDHLMKTAVANNADMTTEVADGTVLSNIISASSDTSTYVIADDSLQGISEGAAGGGATAQQVWEYGTRVLTAGTNLNDLNAAGIRTAIGLASANLDTQLTAISGYVDCLPVTWVVPPSVAQLNARTLLAASYATAANQVIIAAYLDTEITAIKAVTDKLDTTLVQDGAVYDFTTAALAAGPSSSGATAEEVWAYATRTLSAFAFTADANLTQIEGHALVGTGTRIADGFEYFFNVNTPAKTINDCGVAGSGLAAVDVWEYATRTLTQSAATTYTQVSGSVITLARGDTLTAAITGLGSLVTRSKLWFTVKSKKGDAADSAAFIQIEETNGLVYINEDEAATSTNGSITVSDEDDGDLTIVLKTAESAKLPIGSSYVYDIQMLTSAGVVTTLTSGAFKVTEDVTRATD